MSEPLFDKPVIEEAAGGAKEAVIHPKIVQPIEAATAPPVVTPTASPDVRAQEQAAAMQRTMQDVKAAAAAGTPPMPVGTPTAAGDFSAFMIGRNMLKDGQAYMCEATNGRDYAVLRGPDGRTILISHPEEVKQYSFKR